MRHQLELFQVASGDQAVVMPWKAKAPAYGYASGLLCPAPRPAIAEQFDCVPLLTLKFLFRPNLD